MVEWCMGYTVFARPAGRRGALMLAAAMSVTSALGQAQEVRPAGTLFGADYQAEIGRVLAEPFETQRVVSRAELGHCEATCDAFVPRQPILTVEWENEAAGTSADPAAAAAETEFRLDVSGTATGFDEGTFATIRLSRIPVTREVVLDPVGALPQAGAQVLLNRVENGSVVERPADLPIFLSPDAMSRGMPQLEPRLRAEIESDQMTGALSQIRVLGRGSTPIQGESHQIVTMAGLQPGATYRLRLVDEAGATANTVFEQICRVPVCPADFLNPGQ